jgi:hypothetical protein
MKQRRFINIRLKVILKDILTLSMSTLQSATPLQFNNAIRRYSKILRGQQSCKHKFMQSLQDINRFLERGRIKVGQIFRSNKTYQVATGMPTTSKNKELVTNSNWKDKGLAMKRTFLISLLLITQPLIHIWTTEGRAASARVRITNTKHSRTWTTSPTFWASMA